MVDRDVVFEKWLQPDVAIVSETVPVRTVHDAPDGVMVRSGENGLFYEKRTQRVYIDDPSEAPEDYEIQEGARGGLYYEMPPKWEDDVPDGYDVSPFYGDMDRGYQWDVLKGQGFVGDVQGEGAQVRH
jgi:hypothetical protein